MFETPWQVLGKSRFPRRKVNGVYGERSASVYEDFTEESFKEGRGRRRGISALAPSAAQPAS